METKREIDLEKARQYLVAIENTGKSLPEILIGFAEKETTFQRKMIKKLYNLSKHLYDLVDNPIWKEHVYNRYVGTIKETEVLLDYCTRDALLEKDNDIQIVGNCANCGVEYHIHQQTTSQQQTIERLREVNEKLKKALNIIIGFEEYQGRKGCTYGDTDFDSMSAAKGFNDCLDYVKSIAASRLQEAEQLLNTTEPIDSEHGFIECGVCWGEGYVEINEDTESVVCWHCNGKKKIKKNQ